MTPPFGLVRADGEYASDFAERYVSFFRDAVEDAHNHHEQIVLVYTDDTVYSHGGYAAPAGNERFYEFGCHHYNDAVLAQLADIVVMRPSEGPERVVVDHAAGRYSDEIYRLAVRPDDGDG